MNLLPSLNKEFCNNYYLGRIEPDNKFNVWSLKEDFLFVKLIFEGNSITQVSKNLNRLVSHCKKRFVKLFGTTDWVWVVTRTEEDKKRILMYLEQKYMTQVYTFVWDNDTLQETYDFLKYYGF